jgi:hypothetical protein
MKSLIALITTIVFFCSSTEFIELFKLPLLVQHYSKHKTETGSLSLFTFLKHHYSKESKNDNDDNEDSQLPFKTLNDNYTALVYLPVRSFIILNVVEDVLSHNSHYSNGKFFNLIPPIFHPPDLIK